MTVIICKKLAGENLAAVFQQGDKKGDKQGDKEASEALRQDIIAEVKQRILIDNENQKYPCEDLSITSLVAKLKTSLAKEQPTAELTSELKL